MGFKALIEMNSIEIVREENNKISFFTKLFCMSLAVEPLMFFVLTDPNQTGLALTLGRLLQTWVGIYFFAFVIKKGLTVPNPLNRYYVLYFKYILVGLFSSALGVVFYDSYILENKAVNADISSRLALTIRGPYSRPFFELIIAVYYFIYFVVVPRYVIKNESELRYLLDLLVNVFKFGLIVGVLDVVQSLVTGINFIPRHLVDSLPEGGVGFRELGTRYHGFAGEPRDAFPYLVFGLAIYFLRSILFKRSPPSKSVIGLTALALLLTQSASGLIGVVFAIFIYILVDLKINVARLAQIAVALIFSTVVVVLTALNTDRIMEYVTAAEDLFDVLTAGDVLHPILFAQSSNIFPLWQFFLNLQSFKILPVILGSGIGSASFINNNLGGLGELVNPQSNAIRLFYEAGLLGVWFYVKSQILLIQRVSKNFLNANGRFFYFLAILLTGICLGHRSTTIFILCGITLVVISIEGSISQLH
jgi:hypothetical protein